MTHLGLLVHKSRESLVIVGGLFDNLIVLLVWEKSHRSLKQIPVITMKPSKIRMPHFGKK